MRKEYSIEAADGKKLHMYKWDDIDNCKGIVQLVHGSCEHSGRYEEFCKFLNSKGYMVYANDHRGHGKSESCTEDLGFFADVDGWEKLVADLKQVNEIIHRENEGKKVFMFGHSMGSFLARHYSILYGKALDGLILSGTAHNPRILLRLGLLLSNIEIKRKGLRFRSNLLYKLSYDSFNRKFKPARTGCDWISSDPEAVDKFRKDDRCGFVFTAAAFKDMFRGLLFITDNDNISKMEKHLPVLIVSGKEDPVGGMGKMVKKTYKVFANKGIKDLTIKLYEGMRHEILHEKEKHEVYKDILNWIDRRG